MFKQLIYYRFTSMSKLTFGETFATTLAMLLAVTVTPKSPTASIKTYSIPAQANVLTTLSVQQLTNTEWLLEDLSGRGVLAGVQTTLRFNELNRISEQGGCNRYNAQA